MEFNLENLKEYISVSITFKPISEVRFQMMWVEFTCLEMESRNVPFLNRYWSFKYQKKE